MPWSHEIVLAFLTPTPRPDEPAMDDLGVWGSIALAGAAITFVVLAIRQWRRMNRRP